MTTNKSKYKINWYNWGFILFIKIKAVSSIISNKTNPITVMLNNFTNLGVFFSIYHSNVCFFVS